MAINPETQYPGKIAPSTPDYPYGAARNVTIPGDGTGTPWEAAIVNDLLGFQQALLDSAAIVPSGTPDKVGASQYLEALGKRAGVTKATVADMVADTTLKLGQVVGIEDYAAGNGAGLMIGSVVAAGTGTDDGGSFIDLPNTTPALQWKQNFRKGYVNVKQFGAKNVTPDATPQFNAAAAYLDGAGGGTLAFAGLFRIEDTINVPPSVHLEGGGQSNTILQTHVTGATPALSMDGTAVSANTHCSWKKFALVSQNLDGYGINLKNVAFASFEDINTENFAIHWFGRDVLSNTFTAVRGRFGPAGAVGVWFANGGVSNPNNLTFVGCTFASLAGIGMRIDSPSNLNYFGGSIESCGSGANEAVEINNPGGQGQAAFNFFGTYFEGNGGTADIRIEVNGSTVKTSGNVVGCSFNRIDGTTFTTHNILLQQVAASDGYVTLNVTGNGFQSFGSYVPDAARKYISVQSASEYRIVEEGNMYSDAIEIPELFTSGVTYGASIDVNAEVFDRDGEVVVDIADANAFTINAPTNPRVGQTLTFVIRNASGGVAGALTWDAIYRLGAAWVQPANLNNRSITFKYLPTKTWAEVSRVGQDILG